MPKFHFALSALARVFASTTVQADSEEAARAKLEAFVQDPEYHPLEIADWKLDTDGQPIDRETFAAECIGEEE